MSTKQTLMLSAAGHFVEVEIGHSLAAIRTSRGS